MSSLVYSCESFRFMTDLLCPNRGAPLYLAGSSSGVSNMLLGCF